MSKNSFNATVFITALLAVAFVASPALAAHKVYKMTGRIEAIDLKDHTAVIDVPMAKSMFTVAGPLSPHAVLMNRGKKALLDSFKKGEKVTVKWEATKDGHLIEAIKRI